MTQRVFSGASNAFNRLNRSVCLLDVQHLFPALVVVLINTYRQPAKLFVDGETLQSAEGTTQGDPLAMVMYALGPLPLIREAAAANAVQAWYADDSTAASKIIRLRECLPILETRGPAYGYYTNAAMSVLLVKPQFLNIAREVFADTALHVTADGHRHLGAGLGTEQYCNQYVAQVEQWCEEFNRLATYALSQLQAAYTAFSQGLKHKWSFIVRTLPGAADLQQPLEDVIRNDFIPTLTGRHQPNSMIRAVLDLQYRLGGLGIVRFSQLSDEHQRSLITHHPSTP